MFVSKFILFFSFGVLVMPCVKTFYLSRSLPLLSLISFLDIFPHDILGLKIVKRLGLGLGTWDLGPGKWEMGIESTPSPRR